MVILLCGRMVERLTARPGEPWIMTRPAWRELGPSYRLAQGRKEDELRARIGHDALLWLARRSPNSLVNLAREALSRVRHLPEFPTEPRWKFKMVELLPKFYEDARFVREFVKGSLALADEVAETGKFGDSLEILKKTYKHLEWSKDQGLLPFDSPLREAARHLAFAVRYYCENEETQFVNMILGTFSDVVILGLFKTEAYSKKLEEFVVDEVARIKAEKARDPGSLEGATLPEVAKAPLTEQALALLDQFASLVESNPSILGELMPRLSELMQFVERHHSVSTERTLNARQAGRRIGISHVQVLRLLEEGRLGTRDAEGNPRFSEQECDTYRDSDRKRGRPPKPDTTP